MGILLLQTYTIGLLSTGHIFCPNFHLVGASMLRNFYVEGPVLITNLYSLNIALFNRHMPYYRLRKCLISGNNSYMCEPNLLVCLFQTMPYVCFSHLYM